MISTYFLSVEVNSHLSSGSKPALSFSKATKKMFFSTYVVYNVNIPISMKYLDSVKVKLTVDYIP